MGDLDSITKDFIIRDLFSNDFIILDFSIEFKDQMEDNSFEVR